MRVFAAIAVVLILALAVFVYHDSDSDQSAEHEVVLLTEPNENADIAPTSQQRDDGLGDQEERAEYPPEESVDPTNRDPVDHRQPAESNNADRIITTENFGILFHTEPFETIDALREALDEQNYDINWSGQAIDAINQVLTQQNVSEHASEWLVDCKSTICIVEFPDSALEEFDDKEATALLENIDFERVGWFRHYQQDTALLLLLTSEFSFDRGK